MLPTLVSLGPLRISSIGLFLMLAWAIWTFLFWKRLRDFAIEEDKIYSLMFASSIIAFCTARLTFVLSHWNLFSDTWLRIFTIWIQPGLSLYGALIGGIFTIVYLSTVYGLRLGVMLDVAMRAFGIAFIVGSVGSFLDGAQYGIVGIPPWAVTYMGHIGRRHPVQIYEMIYVTFICLLLWIVGKKFHAYYQRRPGLYAVWFFFYFSLGMFCLEYLKESSVYLGGLRFNQWILVAIFAESCGMLYVRGGGRGYIRRIYATISKRFLSKRTVSSGAGEETAQ